MTVTFQWVDASQTTIHVTCQGRWTWSEVFRTQIEIHDLIAGRSDAVNFIITWNNEHWIPGGINENMARVLKNLPPSARIGKVVVVRPNPLFEQLIQLFVRLTARPPFEFTFADTIEEAYLMLEPACT